MRERAVAAVAWPTRETALKARVLLSRTSERFDNFLRLSRSLLSHFLFSSALRHSKNCGAAITVACDSHAISHVRTCKFLNRRYCSSCSHQHTAQWRAALFSCFYCAFCGVRVNSIYKSKISFQCTLSFLPPPSLVSLPQRVITKKKVCTNGSYREASRVGFLNAPICMATGYKQKLMLLLRSWLYLQPRSTFGVYAIQSCRRCADVNINSVKT